VVCKRVNLLKSDVRRARDPFYELRIMQLVRELGFVTVRPLARIAQRGVYYSITEKAEGLRWVQRWGTEIKKDERTRIRAEAKAIMVQLEVALAEVGIRRPWNIKDMIMQLDPDTYTVQAVIPVDWERVTLDFDRLQQTPIGHLLRELQRRKD